MLFSTPSDASDPSPLGGLSLPTQLDVLLDTRSRYILIGLSHASAADLTFVTTLGNRGQKPRRSPDAIEDVLARLEAGGYISTWRRRKRSLPWKPPSEDLWYAITPTGTAVLRQMWLLVTLATSKTATLCLHSLLIHGRTVPLFTQETRRSLAALEAQGHISSAQEELRRPLCWGCAKVQRCSTLAPLGTRFLAQMEAARAESPDRTKGR